MLEPVPWTSNEKRAPERARADEQELGSGSISNAVLFTLGSSHVTDWLVLVKIDAEGGAGGGECGSWSGVEMGMIVPGQRYTECQEFRGHGQQQAEVTDRLPITGNPRHLRSHVFNGNTPDKIRYCVYCITQRVMSIPKCPVCDNALLLYCFDLPGLS
jgi:hypothetical protein